MNREDYRKLFDEVARLKYGIDVNFLPIESELGKLRNGGALTYDHLEAIANDNLWPFSQYWRWPVKEQIKKELEKTKDWFVDLPKGEGQVVTDLLNIFKEISLVSVILRFVAPEHYGIYSRPPLKVLQVERGKDDIEEYLNYLEELRFIKEIYKGIRVADVDMMVWAVAHLGEEYLVKLNRDIGRAYSEAVGPSTDYYVAMAKGFWKSMQKMDRNLKGRVLDAIRVITDNPIEPRGDTIQPLKGDNKGLWRYRLGDFRLQYLPDEKNRLVTLIEFSSRGHAYE